MRSSDGDREAAMKSIDGSLQHLGFITEKIQSMKDRRVAAEEQLVHRIGIEHAAGVLSDADLASLYEAYKSIASTGFSIRWDAAVSLKSSRLRCLSVNGSGPNGLDGSWHGEGRPAWPGGPAPTAGTSVVYVLYEDDWTPCYVGSSSNFRQRMRDHAANKRFRFWRAWPCIDRADAYRREDEMLAEVMPHLNRRREGRRS